MAILTYERWYLTVVWLAFPWWLLILNIFSFCYCLSMYFLLKKYLFRSSRFSSAAQSCPNHWDPTECSTPGLSVHLQLPEFTQTYVHWVCDAIQPYHPLSSSSCLWSFPESGSFQMSQFFTSGSQNIEVSASISVLPMNTQDWCPLGWTGWISLQSKVLVQSIL